MQVVLDARLHEFVVYLLFGDLSRLILHYDRAWAEEVVVSALRPYDPAVNSSIAVVISQRQVEFC